MSSVCLLLLVAACGLTSAQRGAHVSPSLEERAAMRRGPCQDGWTFSESRCFRLSPAAAAWSEARRQCSELRPSARLAPAETPADQLLVRALWREAVRTQPAPRRQEAALWIDLAPPRTRTAERTKAALRDGYGALKNTQPVYTPPGAVFDQPAAAVVVEAGAEDAESKCPSLAADQAAADGAGYGCEKKLLYVCELDSAELNVADV